jgi:hypothetical protein
MDVEENHNSMPYIVDRAVRRLEEQAAILSDQVRAVNELGIHEELESIRAELRRVQQQIDGASIDVTAECNEGDGTITVTATLNWGD